MRPINWLFNWLILISLFAWEMVKSVYDVFLNVLNPHRITQSAIIEVPLDVKSDLGVALLANMITLTPGTTTLHVSESKGFLYAHVMNYSDSEVEGIKQGFERRILKVLR
ncbi:MAG TPA: Na+/H+ antiporter subunit E [Oligella sp.]|jgi:multicomponent Na+:H+ antiporter subunit E|nr:Na+/H+ antiporter subunit E [Oligella sp.]